MPFHTKKHREARKEKRNLKKARKVQARVGKKITEAMKPGGIQKAQAKLAKKKKKITRKEKIASDKWVLGEKLTKAGRSRSRRRKMEKKFSKIRKAGGTVAFTKKKGDPHYMSPAKKKMLGSKKAGRVRKGAVGADVTEGGVYAKYKKGSKTAGKFQSAFKKGCAGGAKSFTWDGRSYSCAKE